MSEKPKVGYWVDGRFIALKRGFKKAKVRKPIPKMSSKRRLESRIYSKKRKAFLAENRVCHVCQKNGELRNSEDVHHTKGRLGGGYLDESTWLAVCRPCHMWIHEFPSAARARGLIK